MRQTTVRPAGSDLRLRSTNAVDELVTQGPGRPKRQSRRGRGCLDAPLFHGKHRTLRAPGWCRSAVRRCDRCGSSSELRASRVVRSSGHRNCRLTAGLGVPPGVPRADPGADRRAGRQPGRHMVDEPAHHRDAPPTSGMRLADEPADTSADERADKRDGVAVEMVTCISGRSEVLLLGRTRDAGCVRQGRDDAGAAARVASAADMPRPICRLPVLAVGRRGAQGTSR